MASLTETQEKPKIKIYSWWRSSASARVLITLHLKGLDYEYKEINILKGDQFTPEFKKISPRSFVPVLVDGDVVITESTAIIQYLEERYPQPSILPPQGEFQKRALHYQVHHLTLYSLFILYTHFISSIKLQLQFVCSYLYICHFNKMYFTN